MRFSRLFLSVLAETTGCEDKAKFRSAIAAGLSKLGVDAAKLAKLDDRSIVGESDTIRSSL